VKAVLLAIAALSMASPAARAASPDSRRSDTEFWHGRACTPLGCRPAPRGSVADALGFGAAAFGSAWLARRRPR
jgi:hypothetical protein